MCIVIMSGNELYFNELIDPVVTSMTVVSGLEHDSVFMAWSQPGGGTGA